MGSVPVWPRLYDERRLAGNRAIGNPSSLRMRLQSSRDDFGRTRGGRTAEPERVSHTTTGSGVVLTAPTALTRFSTPVTAPLTQTSVGNLTASAQRYLDRLGLGVEDLFHISSPPCTIPPTARRMRGTPDGVTAHPLLGWPDGRAKDARDALVWSARGRDLAALLNSDTRFPA